MIFSEFIEKICFMEKMTEKLLCSLNLYIGAKDKNSKYIFCNEKVAEAAGVDSPRQLMGKTDYDLIWRDQADLYRAGDVKVLQGKCYINQAEVQTRRQGLAKVLVNKSKFLNKSDKCIGSMFSYIEVSDFYLKKKSPNFTCIKNRFNLGAHFGNEYLTKREVDVLKYILVAYTAKQIAQIFQLSLRTVETHIEKIKKKLQCQTKADIIVTAMNSSLTYSLLDDDFWS